MLDKMTKYSPSGLAGILLGFALIWWIDPTTAGGVAILFFLSILCCIALGLVVRFFLKLRSGKNSKSLQSSSEAAPEIWLPGDKD